MKPQKRAGMLLVAIVLLGAAAPEAGAATVESIDGRSVGSGTSTTTFTNDGATRYSIRCRHDITISTTAFSGSSSVSIAAASNLYSNCRDDFGAACTVRLSGPWTLTAPATTSGTIRLDLGSSVIIDCTSRSVRIYSCVYRFSDAQSWSFTFTNPVAPARTGTLRLDSPNAIRLTIEASSRRCPLGSAGGRITFTMSETISTENLRIR